MLQKLKSTFVSTLSLIRVELFFGACFSQFYAFLCDKLSDIIYAQLAVDIFSAIFIVVLLISFWKPQHWKNYRIISNVLYLIGSIYILYVAYANNYSEEAFFLVIFSFVFLSFAMPNTRILGIVSGIYYPSFILSYYFLHFEPITPFWVAFSALLFVGISAFFIVFARDVYKQRIKERERLMKHIFNDSNDGLLLLCKKSYVVEDCNAIAERMLNIKKENVIGQELLSLSLKGKTLFEHMDIYDNETIELASKEIIHYQKKVLDYPNYPYILVQVKRFSSKAQMRDTYKLSWR